MKKVFMHNFADIIHGMFGIYLTRLNPNAGPTPDIWTGTSGVAGSGSFNNNGSANGSRRGEHAPLVRRTASISLRFTASGNTKSSQRQFPGKDTNGYANAGL